MASSRASPANRPLAMASKAVRAVRRAGLRPPRPRPVMMDPSTAPAQGEQVYQLEQSRDQGGEVGQGRSAEDGADGSYLAAADVAAVGQSGQGPAGSVELHRQGHQLEQHRQGKEYDAQIHQLQRPQDEPQDDQGHGQVGADLGNGHDTVAQVKPYVAVPVLEGVTHLVGGYPQGSQGTAVVDAFRQ